MIVRCPRFAWRLREGCPAAECWGLCPAGPSRHGPRCFLETLEIISSPGLPHPAQSSWWGWGRAERRRRRSGGGCLRAREWRRQVSAGGGSAPAAPAQAPPARSRRPARTQRGRRCVAGLKVRPPSACSQPARLPAQLVWCRRLWPNGCSRAPCRQSVPATLLNTRRSSSIRETRAIGTCSGCRQHTTNESPMLLSMRTVASLRAC